MDNNNKNQKHLLYKSITVRQKTGAVKTFVFTAP